MFDALRSVESPLPRGPLTVLFRTGTDCCVGCGRGTGGSAPFEVCAACACFKAAMRC